MAKLNRPTTENKFARHKNIRTALKQRLIREGRYSDYRAFVAALVVCGVPDSGDLAAWKIAAFACSPINGKAPELKADPYFADIAREWAAGKFPEPPGLVKFPNGLTDFDHLASEPSPEFKAAAEKIKTAEGVYDDKWEELAELVGDKRASELECVRWVVRNYLTSFDRIDPEEVPDRVALALLKHAKASMANFAELIKGPWTRLLPDRKALDEANKMADDGRDLKLLKAYEDSLDASDFDDTGNEFEGDDDE